MEVEERSTLLSAEMHGGLYECGTADELKPS
jgi:hypothetical protein